MIFVTMSLFGCQQAADESPNFGEPWSTVDATVPSDGIRVLLYHDMEGLAGQDDPRTFSFSEPDHYPQGQEMLVADINAVVEGLFAGGASEVHIVDGHGSGNQQPDVRTDLLDPRAKQVFKDEYFDAYFDLPEIDSYDAVGVVGMHAKTGSSGFASHTFTRGIDLLLNGRGITETELVALSWGRNNTPVIFASGDDRLKSDLQTMPWLEYVQVKTATSADSADLRPVDEVHAEMTAAAKRAVENLADARVMKANLPVRATLHTVPPADISFMEGVPGIVYDEDTVTFDAENLRDAYDGLVALVGVARRAYSTVLLEQLSTRDDFADILSAYRDGLTARWFDTESGRYQKPETSTASAVRGHGYR